MSGRRPDHRALRSPAPAMKSEADPPKSAHPAPVLVTHAEFVERRERRRRAISERTAATAASATASPDAAPEPPPPVEAVEEEP